MPNLIPSGVEIIKPSLGGDSGIVGTLFNAAFLILRQRPEGLSSASIIIPRAERPDSFR